MIGISACLAGYKCRYDLNSQTSCEIKELIKDRKDIFFFCPEQLGGLSTPRIPCEIVDRENIIVKNKNGEDKTEQFLRGASEAIILIEFYEPELLVLKENSPSCGVNKIYDGTFSGELVSDSGVLVKLLKRQKIDIDIMTENDIAFK
ncbi:MAG: DUF523 domain-containing protein [Candidatus Muiribacterium halophilum]|uniref:DUF523 domain-containing protein n=1 Tax=Muiribacterium halophilum TaxID=2053465 RepID=A0A2N5ZL12_MUIH1|nr:MAG: DUF523 domain-containing protein [Candidatus Muirbacterium halophilum]